MTRKQIYLWVWGPDRLELNNLPFIVQNAILTISTITYQRIENKGVAVLSRITPIILKLYR